MKDFDTNRALDIIKEFANIGSGNAATALASLLDMELVNEVTSCKMLPLSEVPKELGGEEQIVAGIYSQLCGEMRSSILVVVPRKSAEMMLRRVTKEPADLSRLTPLQISALSEIGNICLCWYLVAVSKLIKLDLIPAPPDSAVDLLGAVLDLPLANLGATVDTVIAVHTVFKAHDEEFDGYFLLLPERQMLKAIMDNIGDALR
jgi:chemotaxis protein CheC